MKYWSYPFNPPIKKEFQLDLNQGNTPYEKAPEEIRKLTKIDNIYFKREDFNPNGSFKDRALAYQISYLYEKGEKYCVLSSSGNAAISCCSFAQKTNIKPIILVSPNITENKLSQIINNKPYLLIKSKNARRLANYIHRKHNIPILNPTKDNKASIGFETLGQEIYQQNPDCDAIFSYSTSGASLFGIYNYYKKNNLKIPQIFPIQNFNNKTEFYKYTNKDSYNNLKKIHSNKLIVSKKIDPKYQNILHKNNIFASIESAICLQALIELSKENINTTLIISGKEHDTLLINPNYPIHNIETKENIDTLLNNTND